MESDLALEGQDVESNPWTTHTDETSLETSGQKKHILYTAMLFNVLGDIHKVHKPLGASNFLCLLLHLKVTCAALSLNKSLSKEANMLFQSFFFSTPTHNVCLAAWNLQ